MVPWQRGRENGIYRVTSSAVKGSLEMTARYIPYSTAERHMRVPYWERERDSVDHLEMMSKEIFWLLQFERNFTI